MKGPAWQVFVSVIDELQFWPHPLRCHAVGQHLVVVAMHGGDACPGYLCGQVRYILPIAAAEWTLEEGIEASPDLQSAPRLFGGEMGAPLRPERDLITLRDKARRLLFNPGIRLEGVVQEHQNVTRRRHEAAGF
jgi:hypothetical protein